MAKPRLRANPRVVEVGLEALDNTLNDYVLDTALVLNGRNPETDRVLQILVDGEMTRVKIASVVLVPGKVRRVALRASNVWPVLTDRGQSAGSYYYVCDRTPNGWSARQTEYYYDGDDGEIDWFDFPAGT